MKIVQLEFCHLSRALSGLINDNFTKKNVIYINYGNLLSKFYFKSTDLVLIIEIYRKQLISRNI